MDQVVIKLYFLNNRAAYGLIKLHWIHGSNSINYRTCSHLAPNENRSHVLSPLFIAAMNEFHPVPEISCIQKASHTIQRRDNLNNGKKSNKVSESG